MSPPVVSVCIPAYRNAEALERAFKSLQRQQFKDFEVVITDDSPDDVVE
jgi:glycosyltransferase involved in cell wall biosynthesis